MTGAALLMGSNRDEGRFFFLEHSDHLNLSDWFRHSVYDDLRINYLPLSLGLWEKGASGGGAGVGQ